MSNQCLVHKCKLNHTRSMWIILPLTKQRGEKVIPGWMERGQYSFTEGRSTRTHNSWPTFSRFSFLTPTLTLQCLLSPQSQGVPWTQPAFGGLGTWSRQKSTMGPITQSALHEDQNTLPPHPHPHTPQLATLAGFGVHLPFHFTS